MRAVPRSRPRRHRGVAIALPRRVASTRVPGSVAVVEGGTSTGIAEPLPAVRLPDREVRAGTRGLLTLDARECGSNQAPMRGAFLGAALDVGLVRRFLRGRVLRGSRRDCRIVFGVISKAIGALLSALLGALSRAVVAANPHARRARGGRFRLGCRLGRRFVDDPLWSARQNLRVQRGRGVLTTLSRDPRVLVLVIGVACRAPRLFHILVDHGDDDVIGDAPFARTVIVENVTKPRLALHLLFL